MSPNAGGSAGSQLSANEYSCAHGAQINFGDLTPYLTYALNTWLNLVHSETYLFLVANVSLMSLLFLFLFCCFFPHPLQSSVVSLLPILGKIIRLRKVSPLAPPAPPSLLLVVKSPLNFPVNKCFILRIVSFLMSLLKQRSCCSCS